MGFLSDEIQKALPRKLVFNYRGDMEDQGFVNTGVGMVHISDLRSFSDDVSRFLKFLPTALCYFHGYLEDVIPVREDWSEVELTLGEIKSIREADKQQQMEQMNAISAR